MMRSGQESLTGTGYLHKRSGENAGNSEAKELRHDEGSWLLFL